MVDVMMYIWTMLRMLLSRTGYLFCIHLPHRHRIALLIFLLLTFITFLSITGCLEELFISHALPLFYWTRSSFSSTHLSLSVPPVLLSPPNACSSPPFLLILVYSAPSHREQRDAIRQTWGSHSYTSEVLTLFMLGVPQLQEERVALAQEATVHEDIVQANFMDTYQNLTLKTLAVLTWTSQRCTGAWYLLKVDDDVFVNTISLIKFLKRQNVPLYLGMVHWKSIPNRNPQSHYYIPVNVYESSNYPPYCSGPSYVLSQDMIKLLLQAVGKCPLLPMEDVYVGLLAEKVGVSPQHTTRMARSNSLPYHGCCYTAILTSHQVTPQQIREIWSIRAEAEKTWCPLEVLQCRVFGR